MADLIFSSKPINIRGRAVTVSAYDDAGQPLMVVNFEVSGIDVQVEYQLCEERNNPYTFTHFSAGGFVANADCEVWVYINTGVWWCGDKKASHIIAFTEDAIREFLAGKNSASNIQRYFEGW